MSHVARKISKSIGIIYQASFCLSKVSLYKLYYSLVYPYMQYLFLFSAHAYPMNINRIVLLQKRISFIYTKTVSIICFYPQNKFSNMIHVILIYIMFLFVAQNLDNFQLFIRLQFFLNHIVGIFVMHQLFIVFNLN